MIREISEHLKTLFTKTSEDSIIFKNQPIQIDKNHFQEILKKTGKSIAFIDGGQAEILSASNFCLSFIRVYSVIFEGNKKTSNFNEFYILTTGKYVENELFYNSKIFTEKEKLIDENDLLLNSNHPSLKTGNRRAAISKISNIARRFAELSLAAQTNADEILLDGTLEITYPNEEKYMNKLGKNVSALAKTTDVVTVNGNNPSVVLNHPGCWRYFVINENNKEIFFVKLHDQSNHVFRFEGNKEALSYLLKNSSDPIFLGYPYGLIYADKHARVSNKEKDSLTLQFLMRNENLRAYLNSKNSHSILDSIS